MTGPVALASARRSTSSTSAGRDVCCDRAASCSWSAMAGTAATRGRWASRPLACAAPATGSSGSTRWRAPRATGRWRPAWPPPGRTSTCSCPPTTWAAWSCWPRHWLTMPAPAHGRLTLRMKDLVSELAALGRDLAADRAGGGGAHVRLGAAPGGRRPAGERATVAWRVRSAVAASRAPRTRRSSRPGGGPLAGHPLRHQRRAGVGRRARVRRHHRCADRAPVLTAAVRAAAEPGCGHHAASRPTRRGPMFGPAPAGRRASRRPSRRLVDRRRGRALGHDRRRCCGRGRCLRPRADALERGRSRTVELPAAVVRRGVPASDRGWSSWAPCRWPSRSWRMATRWATRPSSSMGGRRSPPTSGSRMPTAAGRLAR